MSHTFVFTIVCKPRGKRLLITEYNNAANAISRNLAALIKALNVICRPQAQFSLEHAENDKAHQFTYHFNTKQTDTRTIIYARIPEVIYFITKRVLSSRYDMKGKTFRLNNEELEQINVVIKKPLTEFQAKTLSDHFVKMIRSLNVPLKSVAIEIFQGHAKTSCNVNSEEPPLALFPDSEQTINRSNNVEVRQDPYEKKVEDHIVEPEQHKIDLFAAYKSRLDAINVGGKISDNEIRLSFTPESLGEFCDICTERLGSLEAIIDTTPDENGHHKILEIIGSASAQEEL
nr:hypothetical protein [uncultured Desulfuromonas sp.]